MSPGATVRLTDGILDNNRAERNEIYQVFIHTHTHSMLGGRSCLLLVWIFS